jgi:cytoskeleton protein RodZ
MSDSTTTPPSQGPGEQVPTSAGAWLREERQKRGLHIAAVAAMLKVPQAKLEALEADRWQDLTDMTFVRALAKAVCRTLKVDAEPVLALLPRGGERELDVSKGINTPFRERGNRDEGFSMALLQRPIVWGPVLLLLAAALVYVLPNKLLEPTPAPAPVEAAASVPTPIDPAASTPVLVEPTVQAASTAPIISAAASAVASNPTPSASKPVQALAAAPSAPSTAVSGAALPVRIHVKAESWIQVTDARGQVLINGVVKPGEDPSLVGQLPLRLIIGNVAGTELSLRGSPVDLASWTKDNVARLELN